MNLLQAIDAYYGLRELTKPNAEAAERFFYQEIGEFNETFTLGPGFKRNNPAKEAPLTEAEILVLRRAEWWDVLMMWIWVGRRLGVFPLGFADPVTIGFIKNFNVKLAAKNLPVIPVE